MNLMDETLFKSSPVIHRYADNPILTAQQVPYHATLIFNAGVAKYQGRYVMVFRNDYGEWGNPVFQGTNLGLAFSDDGIRWQVEPQPIWDRERAAQAASHLLEGRDPQQEVLRAYDPRLTVIDGRIYMCFAMDTRHGLRGGIARTDDFSHFEVLSLSAPDNRNMVLFPEQVHGQYLRLERPMPVYSRGKDRFDLWLSASPDLRLWNTPQLVIGVEDVPFANDKIGPGAPPIRTPFGWLALYHAVDIDASRGKNGWEPRWTKRYSIGIMLLDLEHPWRVIGHCSTPLMTPETRYEKEEGFRTDVLFPGGMILEDSGEVKIYYGGADTVECLATADLGDLLKLCGK
jgi:beta-1,4-mannooligosaccharide/beta-1,4-mannosyl-N-acetylglucosamine phosphorylase